MPKKKVAVAISDWLLVELDAAAGEADVSRSAMVEEAVADYVVRRRNRLHDEEFRKSARLALDDMKRFAAEYDDDAAAADEPESLEKIRALRGEGSGTRA